MFGNGVSSLSLTELAGLSICRGLDNHTKNRKLIHSHHRSHTHPPGKFESPRNQSPIGSKVSQTFVLEKNQVHQSTTRLSPLPAGCGPDLSDSYSLVLILDKLIVLTGEQKMERCHHREVWAVGGSFRDRSCISKCACC